MLSLLWAVLGAARSLFRRRQELALENLALRQQVAVLIPELTYEVRCQTVIERKRAWNPAHAEIAEPWEAAVRSSSILAGVFAASIGAAPQTSPDEAAVRDVVHDEIAAWNSGDAAAYSRHFAADGTPPTSAGSPSPGVTTSVSAQARTRR